MCEIILKKKFFTAYLSRLYGKNAVKYGFLRFCGQCATVKQRSGEAAYAAATKSRSETEANDSSVARVVRAHPQGCLGICMPRSGEAAQRRSRVLQAAGSESPKRTARAQRESFALTRRGACRLCHATSAAKSQATV